MSAADRAEREWCVGRPYLAMLILRDAGVSEAGRAEWLAKQGVPAGDIPEYASDAWLREIEAQRDTRGRSIL